MSAAAHCARTADGAIVADRLRPAHTHWTRLKGLLGTSGLAPGEGLWIKPCRQVHMFGMRYALDVIFLDDGGRVVRTVAGLSPNSISPKVAEAASVLELPVGTIARSGIDIGAQVKIDGSVKGRDRLAGAAAALCNLAIAALFALFAAVHIDRLSRGGAWATIAPIVVQEALLVFLFLTRRRSTSTSPHPFDWLVGATGTALPLFLRTSEQTGRLFWLGAALQIGGLAWVIAGALSLGRSIAIVAGNRGIKQGGLYRLVRHPMYSGYVVSYIGYVAAYPTLRNAAILVGTVAALALRATAEERFLARDPAYRTYLAGTRWRFVPYVY